MLVVDGLTTKPKVLIVEPQKVLLTTLANSLHSKNYGIVGTAVDSTAAIEYFGRVRPDVLITEVDLHTGLNGPTGVDLAVHLRSMFPMLGVVICSSLSDKNLLSAPPRLRETSYFLPKSKITKMSMIELAIQESIRLIRSPETPSHDIYKINSVSLGNHLLSKSDFQLLTYLSYGLSKKEISRRKGIALKSCENGIARLAKKLEIPFLPDTNQRVMLVRAYFEYIGILNTSKKD
jgi:DNA-binding NarL/FixJ family response regulator